MKLLLDTCVLIWWLDDHPNLTNNIREIISNLKNTIYISAATAWEIAIKIQLKKLKISNKNADIETAVASSGFETLSINFHHALAAGSLPMHHQDPFDRLLIAQAKIEELTILTADSRFEAYKVPLIVVC